MPNQFSGEDRGRVTAVHDALDGISTTLKYTVYQIESGGEGGEPSPERWKTSAGHFRSALTKEADLARVMAEQLKRWKRANPKADPADIAVADRAAKYFKSIEKSLLNSAKNAGHAKACLDSFGT